MRERAWAVIHAVDAARFPGVEGRIPNFVGAEAAADHLAETSEWTSATTLKCNPDSPQLPVRKRALVEGKTIYMAVPKLADPEPFWLLAPDELTVEPHVAASIKGAARHGRPVSLDEMDAIDLIICGSVAVERGGAPIVTNSALRHERILVAMEVIRRALFIAFLTALAACGGDGEGTETADLSSDSGTQETSGSGGDGEGTTEDLVEAARTQFEAFLTRDDETYFDLLSESCRDRLGFAAVTGHLDSRHFRAGLDGVDVSALSVADVLSDGGGSTASVRLVIDGPSGDQFRESLPNSWVYEDGGWHMDDCGDFREAQGGLEGVGMDRNDPLPFGGVADVNGWLVALVHVAADDEAFIVETGGSPASDGNQLFVAGVSVSYDGGEPSIVWSNELGFEMMNGDTVYGDDNECVGPDSTLYVDPATAVGPGETVGRPYICREVPTDHATGMLLRVTHLPTGDEWWFSLGEPD